VNEILNALDGPPPRTLRDHAWMQLRDALMSGRFPPGTKMTIRGLAGALGISPTPVREAVARLAAEGAIEAEPNRWVRVPPLSVAVLRELKEIRLALEGLAAFHAARHLTDLDRAALRAADAAIIRLRPGQQPGEMIPAIRAFHFAVYGAARMPTLVRLIEGLWLRAAPAVNLLFPDYTGRERGRLRAQVLAALEAGDADAARAAMQADIGQALDYLIAIAECQEAGPVDGRDMFGSAKR
jgi:DNA-binding GntR family transcriptional regulator